MVKWAYVVVVVFFFCWKVQVGVEVSSTRRHELSLSESSHFLRFLDATLYTWTNNHNNIEYIDIFW